MGKIIMEQFEKHLNSVALESKKHPSIYKESLFIRTCDTIANTLSELGLKKDAQKGVGYRQRLNIIGPMFFEGGDLYVFCYYTKCKNN